jgi:hypothetical protein
MALPKTIFIAVIFYHLTDKLKSKGQRRFVPPLFSMTAVGEKLMSVIKISFGK